MPLKIDLEAGLRPPPPPLPESGTPDNRFVFQRKIGQGAEGIVYVAVPTRNSDGGSSGLARQHREPVAVKVVTGHAFERCRATRYLWPSLVHSNVVYPRSSYFDNANGQCFIDMELLSSDPLEDIVSKGTLEDSRASEVAGFLASALDHLRQQGVAHCDVKLENVFLWDGTVQLGDLGGIAHIRHSSVTTVPTADQDFGDNSPAVVSSAAATVAGPSSATTTQKAPELLGSTLYAPPESVREGGLGSERGTKRRDLLAGDMWALGVTLYSAVAGCHPWEVANKRVLAAISRVGDFCVLRLPLYLLVRLLPKRVRHASAYPGGSVSDKKFQLLYSLLVSPHINKSTKYDQKFHFTMQLN